MAGCAVATSTEGWWSLVDPHGAGGQLRTRRRCRRGAGGRCRPRAAAAGATDACRRRNAPGVLTNTVALGRRRRSQGGAAWCVPFQCAGCSVGGVVPATGGKPARRGRGAGGMLSKMPAWWCRVSSPFAIPVFADPPRRRGTTPEGLRAVAAGGESTQSPGGGRCCRCSVHAACSGDGCWACLRGAGRGWCRSPAGPRRAGQQPV